MTQHQKDVMRVVWDLLERGAVEIKLEAHVFGVALRIWQEEKGES